MPNITTWKKDFQADLERKEGESPSVIAQRFINIYHQLSVLGEDAVKRYNKMVLEQGRPAVLIALTSMPSGKEVRDYIDFLQNKNAENKINGDKKDKSGALPNLPKAEELSPIWQTLGWGGGTVCAQPSAPAAAITPTMSPNPAPVYIPTPAGVDKEALAMLKEQSLTLLDSQNQDVVHTLQEIITDTNDEKDKNALSDAVFKITSLQERNKDILTSIYQADFPIEARQPIIKTKETRPVFTAGKRKNKKRKPFPKFAVRLIDEDDAS